MTQDIPGDGYYFSAMKAFVTRTAYANIRGDQMVSHLSQTITQFNTTLMPVADYHTHTSRISWLILVWVAGLSPTLPAHCPTCPESADRAHFNRWAGPTQASELPRTCQTPAISRARGSF